MFCDILIGLHAQGREGGGWKGAVGGRGGGWFRTYIGKPPEGSPCRRLLRLAGPPLARSVSLPLTRAGDSGCRGGGVASVAAEDTEIDGGDKMADNRLARRSPQQLVPGVTFR